MKKKQLILVICLGLFLFATFPQLDFNQLTGKIVEKAKKGDEIGLIVSNKVRKGYKVFKKK